MPTELLKELKEDNIKEIQKLFKQWWEHENIDTEELKARVVLIYKKGDTNKFDNYRPISLLNTLYKIFAAILQKRIANRLDKHLQKKPIWIQSRQINHGCNTPHQKNYRIRRKYTKQTIPSTTRLGKSIRQSRQESAI